MKRPRRYLKRTAFVLLPIFVLWCVVPLFAGDGEMGFTNYFFSDSQTNKVITSSFNMARKLLEQTSFLIDIELDHVTVPPITGTTGASRPQREGNQPFEKSRGQVIIGLEQGLGENWTLGANIYRSQEVDYVSSAAVGTLSVDMFRKNTTLTLRGQFNSDKVGKILESGDITWQDKRVITGAVDLTQILSPTTVLDLAYDVVSLKGLLSDPYLQVSVIDDQGGTLLVDELHPSKRLRNAGTARLTQFIPSIRASLLASYRYYGDNWSVHSNTYEMKLNKYVTNDLVFGLDYRYYSQTGAYFYRDTYVGSEFSTDLFRTVDYKLTPFSSNNFGLSLTFMLRALSRQGSDFEFLENSSLELYYFRYFNTLDFSADIVQFAIKFSI